MAEDYISVNNWDYIFPVISGKTIFEDGRFQVPNPQVFGTTAYLGEGLFITAGHVVRNAESIDKIRIGFFERLGENTQLQTLSVKQSEINDSVDLAIMFVHDMVDWKPKSISWKLERLPLNEKVYSVGFPFAIDTENKRINPRLFAGRIAANGRFLFKGNNEIHSYELTFPVARGLSGAPLLVDGEGLIGAGIIVANNEMEMEVTSSREIIKEDSIEKIYTRKEYLSLGVATSLYGLKDVAFDLLGGTFEGYLKKKNLLTK